MKQSVPQEKLQIPSTNFENAVGQNITLNNKSKEMSADTEKTQREFNLSDYKWTLFFVISITTTLLFIKGFSVYKSNLFIS